MHVCMYICMCVCMYVCMYIYIYICMHICIYVHSIHMYVYMYICMYILRVHAYMYIYYMADSRAVIGQFQVCKYPYRPLPLDHLLKRQMISFFSQNNQQSHIINIILALFARSVWQVIDPCFFLPCFHGPCASCLGHRSKEKIICQTDLALC